MKEHIYSTDEYEVKIGDPVVDAEVKASSTSVAIPCEAIPDGKYLVSLEVNGTAIAHRDTFSFASGSCTVGDYTLAYSSYAVTVSTTSNNDVVRLKVEPVEVYVTDAMKAAVAKVAPEAPTELPAITAADDGKVLTANSGVWGAESEVFYFDVAYNLSDGSYTAQNVNREELVDAINKGKRFAMRYTDGNLLTTIIDVQSFGKSATFKSAAHALFIGEATISDDSYKGFTTVNLFASVYPDEDPSITESGVQVRIANHDRFIVTLTPTALDYSGTMDKTVAEIDAAYKEGQEIVFRLYTATSVYIDVPVQLVSTDTDYGYPSFETNVTSVSNNVFIFAQTGTTNDGTKATYSTTIYTLTPAT